MLEYTMQGAYAVVGVWTDSVDLGYSVQYYNEEKREWTLLSYDCTDSITFPDGGIVASKWRLYWESTDFKKTRGLSTARSGGGLHAELLVAD